MIKPSELALDARAHLLRAITSAYAAADELANDNKRSALIEIDRMIVLAHEARKFLLQDSKPAVGQGGQR